MNKKHVNAICEDCKDPSVQVCALLYDKLLCAVCALRLQRQRK